MSTRRRAALREILFALADPTRLRIIELTARGPRRASELADEIGGSRPSISRHLRILRAASLLKDEGDTRDGRATLISLHAPALLEVRAFLDEIEDFWSGQLASFASLAETRARAKKRKAS